MYIYTFVLYIKLRITSNHALAFIKRKKKRYSEALIE